MNKPILRALYLDAYYQVLDNRIFRILAVLVCVLVLPSFLIGFRPEGIVLLWGLKSVTYQEFAGWFGAHLPSDVKDVHVAFIQGVQHLIVGSLAGNLGILLSLAATAFFVPRMLEKGAADVVFSRPIGRATLLAARYFAGVLFVVLLASVLVLGIHAGFLVASGTSDPAFLWSILTLSYVFALVHAVSTVVAVFTRSSVAALLTSMLFFAFNGCVHSGWIQIEAARAKSALEREEAPPGQEDDNLDSGAIGFLTGSVDALHFTLPKTTDAELIVSKLRTLVAGKNELLRDPQGSLLVRPPPEHYQLTSAPGEVDLAQEPATWTRSVGEEPPCTFGLRRESRLRPAEKAGDKPRRRSSAEYSREFFASLKGQAGIEALERSRLQNLRIEPEYVAWNTVQETQRRTHARAFIASGDWMYVLELEGQSQDTPASFAQQRLRELGETLVIDRDDPRFLEADAWYARRLDWTAKLRHNIFFSIGSSLAFAGLLFALAAWKLKRIDF